MEHYWLLGATSAASQMTTKAHCITDDDPEVIAANNNNDARTLLFLAYANARKVQVALICHSYCSSCGDGQHGQGVTGIPLYVET
jgi:hypothetical protein